MISDSLRGWVFTTPMRWSSEPQTDNELVNCTFRELLAEVDDEEWKKVFQYIADRLKATASNETTTEEGGEKNA